MSSGNPIELSPLVMGKVQDSAHDFERTVQVGTGHPVPSRVRRVWTNDQSTSMVIFVRFRLEAN